MSKKYVLRVFSSAKHMTANVVEWNERRLVATASTVEHSISNAFECGRSCDEKAAASVGEVLAMRLKTEEPGARCGVHIDVEREIKKKGVECEEGIWAVVNAMRNRGVKVVIGEAHN
ncbi:hypothetical protein RIF29_20403 [Crotalaria pallida]|uniref:Ribosomal protein L18 n=1 Tax=Crotalaria pallida TaxID=3830 RepID=A0AAN9F3D6_CROPI